MRFNHLAFFCFCFLALLGAGKESLSQVCSLSQIPSNLQNGLVAYYPFCGNANDVSGNNINGTVFNASTTTDRFSGNTAYAFNGSSSYIRANNSALINFGTGSFTLSSWVLSTGGGRWQHFITHTLSTSTPYSSKGYFLRYDNSQPTYGQGNTFTNTGLGAQAPAVNATNWHHIVSVYNVSTLTVSIYVDGILARTESIPTPLQNVDNNGFLYFGVEDPVIPLPSGPQYLTGKLDDIGIWNRALTSCEITQLYNSTVTAIPNVATPTATFSVNAASQCVTGNQFNFTNNSSVTTGTLTYAWTFGDGNVSANANPTHSYINAGTYTVKLVVTSGLGCKDSTTRSVSVFAKPVVNFSVNSLSQCVNGNSFVFTNSTTIASGTVSYVWRFGDGNTATTANATHSYLAAGTYIVKLIAVSNNGCSDSTTRTVTVNPKPTVDFSINRRAQCLSTNQFVFTNLSTITTGTITAAWSFGNGATSVQASPSYSYLAAGSYNVKLVSTSAEGCKDSITHSITVRPMPTGTLNTPTTNLLCEGGTVTLTASGGTTYQWFINGGAIVGATTASYAATQPGTYTVNVVSADGCIASATGAVTLQLVRKPTVNFTFDKYCAGFPTQFTDQSNIANSNVVAYSWNFGQGQGTSTLQNPTYTFPTASTYSVSLIVTPVACPSLATSITKPVSVVAPPANQRYIALNAVENRDLQLEARVFGGAIYSWSPSTGLSSSLISNPIFNYNAEVDYVISITTGIGCILKDTQLVRIFKEKEIYVPKGFSPNGDGNNDKIFPRLVGVRTLTYFKVFNRWGQLLFMTTNINEGWDGTYKGVKQPMEGYVWIAEGIDFDNNLIKRTGTFLLLR